MPSSFFSSEKGPLVSPFSQDTEDVQEEVDNVQVEVHRRVDVFFRGDLVHDHVCIEDDEEGEKDGAADSHGHVHDLALHEDL